MNSQNKYMNANSLKIISKIAQEVLNHLFWSHFPGIAQWVFLAQLISKHMEMFLTPFLNELFVMYFLYLLTSFGKLELKMIENWFCIENNSQFLSQVRNKYACIQTQNKHNLGCIRERACTWIYANLLIWNKIYQWNILSIILSSSLLKSANR